VPAPILAARLGHAALGGADPSGGRPPPHAQDETEQEPFPSTRKCPASSEFVKGRLIAGLSRPSAVHDEPLTTFDEPPLWPEVGSYEGEGNRRRSQATRLAHPIYLDVPMMVNFLAPRGGVTTDGKRPAAKRTHLREP
jgi:hypothetical protein